MRETGNYRFMTVIMTAAALLLLYGCADDYPGYENDGGRALYDQYIDRPGYYDFGQPVIFAPVEQDRSN